MNSITNIHLVDCNRVNSVEYKSGDDQQPASWTNVVHDGLKLNVGDKISVAYSCVNEIGCGSGQIETKGKIIGRVDYQHGELTGDLSASPNGREELGPFATNITTYNPKTTTLDVADNHFNMVISYYKTTNGENYIHLPRRYDSKVDTHTPCVFDEFGTTNGAGPQGWENGIKTNNKIWYQGDGVTNGRPHKIPAVRVFDDWHWYTGNKTYLPRSNVVSQGDAYISDPLPALNEGNETTPCDQYWDLNCWKQKNDNSRYTLFFAQNQYWTSSGLSVEDAEKFDAWFCVRDPALQVYHQYKELKQYSVNSGFNDPNNVAYQLTSQFSDPVLGPQPMLLRQKDYDTSAPTGNDIRVVPDYPASFSMSVKGETYKPFPASNYYSMSRGKIATDSGTPTPTGAYGNYYSQVVIEGELEEQKSKDCVAYQSNFNCIGVKRPEFFTAGRKMMLDWIKTTYPAYANIPQAKLGACYVNPDGVDPSGLELPTYIDWWEVEEDLNVGQNNRWITTSIEWTKENLDNLRDFFKTQKLYPELLNFPKRDQTSSFTGNSDLHNVDTPPVQTSLLDTEQGGTMPDAFHKRFLHMDCFNVDNRGASEKGRRGQFGDDMASPTYRTSETGLEWIDTSTASVPLFFYFDPKREDIYVESNYDPQLDFTSTSTDADNVSDLCYGFAKESRSDFGSFIALNIRGLPDDLLEMCGDGGSDPSTRYINGNYIGYDLHFNAYGNSSILLYTGVLPCNIDNKQVVGVPTQGNARNDTEGQDVYWEPSGGPTTGRGHDGRLIQPYGFSISKIIRQVYIGAIDPIVQFVSANSRFTFGGLHTPEYIQNGNNAGAPLKEATADEDATTIPTEPDAGTEVYKINKRITQWNNYTPEVLPLRDDSSFKAPFWDTDYIKTTSGGGTTNNIRIVGQVAGSMFEVTDEHDGQDTDSYLLYGMVQATQSRYSNYGDQQPRNHMESSNTGIVNKSGITAISENSRAVDTSHEYVEANNNLSPFIVYDSHSGIYLEDWGITDERMWEDSLFGSMGFSYKQMNPTSDTQLNRQTKLTRVNYDTISPLTTSALVPTKDLPTYIKNIYQKPMYTQQLPTPMIASLWYGILGDYYIDNADQMPTTWNSSTDNLQRRFIHIGDVNLPAVTPESVNPQTSHTIMADGLPIKMKSPYYLVKSDILADAYFIREKDPLPIVAVINKENFFGDFAFSQSSQIEYIVSTPKVLTEIRTEIYDADMTFASCGKNSGIIYKITKNVPHNPNLVQQLLNNQGQPKKNTIDINKTGL